MNDEALDSIWCVVPVYNNGATVKDVALGCRKHLAHVLVVDDGSTDVDVAALFADTDIEVLRQGLADVEFREVPGAGHFIYEEQPQAVAEAVEDLVTNLSAGGFPSVGAALVPGDDGGTDPVQPRNSR